MNDQEVKLLLQAYYPGGRDASDPTFAEALELANGNPRLQGWFADERAFDLRIQTKLHDAIPIPSGLKTNLLHLRKDVRLAPGRCQSTWLNTFL